MITLQFSRIQIEEIIQLFQKELKKGSDKFINIEIKQTDEITSTFYHEDIDSSQYKMLRDSLKK